jgi:hypothetical protein
MHVGITYGAGGDLMYTGIIQDPANAGNQTGGDAVIAWGDNQNGGLGQGPDNFRFLFIANLTSATTGPNSDQGRETMRITPRGNVGIGDSFSNALQPHRRAVVHERTDSAQFRIAHTVNANVLLGDHADFQVTDNGILHIKTRHNNQNRAVAIGFLEGELASPVNNCARLDVGGRARIRNLQDTTFHCLVTGFNASANPADNYLTRLDFTGATDSVLSAAGTWVSAEDCRWKETADFFYPIQCNVYGV